MRTFAVLSCLAVCAMSQAIVIETFQIGTISRSIGNDSYVEYLTDPGLYTGERDFYMRGRLFSGTDQGTVVLGNGRLRASTQNGRMGTILEYDGIGDEGGNTGTGRTPITRDNFGHVWPAGARQVRFHVGEKSGLTGLSVALYSRGVLMYENGGNGQVANGVYNVDFHPTNFLECDALIIIISNSQNSVIELTKVEIVPEPATGAALIIGGVALLGRRRKS